MSNLRSYLRRNLHRMMADIEMLVQAESPSLDKMLADRCANVLRDLIQERLGIEAELIPQQQVGNHLRSTVGAGEKQLLLLTHYDTVWEEGRLRYRVEGNKVFGPGIFDMKGGIIQVIWALKACQDLNIPLKRKIVLFCTSDEEIGSRTSRQWIEQEALRSEAVLVTEPAVAQTGALKTARKGVGQFTISILGKAAHAGNHPQDGISAIEEMAHQIRYIHSLTDYAKGTTLNVGIAKGGTRANVVADSAEIHVDLRISNRAEGERVAALIRDLKPVLPGISLRIQGGITRPPLERKQAERLFQLACQCGGQIGLELKEEAVGGGSDGNFTAALGIPTLDGLGLVGDGLHAEHEHILIDQIPERTELLSKLLIQLASNKQMS